MATAGGGGSGGSGSGSGGSGSGSGGGGGGGSSGGGGGNLNDQKLAQFISITGAAEDVAKHYLEASAYSLEGAVNMFMESNVGTAGGEGSLEDASLGGGGSSMTRGGSGARGSGDSDAGGGAHGGGGGGHRRQGDDPNDPDYVRPADPYKRQRLVDDPRSHEGYGGVSAMREWRNPSGANPFRDFAQESRQASHSFAIREGKLSSEPAAAEKQRKLAAMYAPPTDIMFVGDFQAARQAAKLQKKWLLVNIQADAEFDCHRLNRDVWNDEMVQNIIACNCIFWQQPSVSEEAKTYCRRYDATSFPHISLVDPRTGMKVWSFQGFLGPPEFVEKITDVTDKISLQDGAPPRLPPPPPRPPQLPPNTSGSEDQMLAAAIAASLEASSNGSSSNKDDGGIGKGISEQRTRGDLLASSTSSLSSSSKNGSLSVDGNGSGSATSPASVVDDDNEEEDEEDDDGDREVAIVGETFGSAGDKGKGKAKVRRDPENGAAAAMSGETGGAAGGPREAMVGVRRDGRRNESNGDREGGVAEATGAVAAMDVDSAASPDQSESEAGALNGEMLEPPPEDDSPDKTSVRFQFPTGQRVVRRFRKNSTVRQLYLFVASELEGAKTKPFDVRTVRPSSSIRGLEGICVEQAGLSNSAVVVVWED